MDIGAAIVDLCTRAGLDASLVDVSLLEAAPIAPVAAPGGYVIERASTAAAALQEILKAFFIDACESNGRLRFIPRSSSAPVMSLPETDLGLEADNAELTEQWAQEQDLPISVTVLYYDLTLDYQQGKQLKARNPRILTVGTRNQVSLSLPFTLTPDQGRQIAESTLYAAWCNRLGYSVNLWRALYLLLDPSDLVNFTYQGQTYTARILTASAGQGGAVALEAVSEDLRNYVSSAVGGTGTGFSSGGVRPASSAFAVLLDLPLLEDTDSNPSGTGFYYAMGAASAQWPGAVLYESSDNASFGQVAQSSAPVGFGRTTTVLAAPRSPWTWDTDNTLTVSMTLGSLAGATDLNVLNGSNGLIVGGEALQYAAATENPDGTTTISRLLRGRRGTEGACGSHQVGETVLVVGAGFGRLAEPVSRLGVLRYYRAVPVGGDLSAASSQEFTLAGNDLMPYAPVGLAATIGGGGDMTITWVRRTRIGGPWLDGTGTVPLSEQSELYDVEVLDGGGAVKRTFAALTSPSVVYTAAEQTADFGAPVSSVKVRTYQLSAVVGRGFPGVGTV